MPNLWLFLSVICHKTEEDLATRITFIDAMKYQKRFFEIVGDMTKEFDKTGISGIKKKVTQLSLEIPEHWSKN